MAVTRILTVNCKVYSVQLIVHSLQCTVNTAYEQCTLYSVHFSEQCTVQWTVYSVQIKVYIVQWTVYQLFPFKAPSHRRIRSQTPPTNRHCTAHQVWGHGHCTALHCTALHCTALHCTFHYDKSRPVFTAQNIQCATFTSLHCTLTLINPGDEAGFQTGRKASTSGPAALQRSVGSSSTVIQTRILLKVSNKVGKNTFLFKFYIFITCFLQSYTSNS